MQMENDRLNYTHFFLDRPRFALKSKNFQLSLISVSGPLKMYS